MDILVTLYESELTAMQKALAEAKKAGDSSAIYSSLGKHGIDVSFQLTPDEDSTLKAKREFAEKEGRA